MSSTHFDLEFEEEILAQCLREPGYMRKAQRLLSRRHFTMDTHSWVWRVISETWAKHAEVPTPRIFVSRVSRDILDEDKRKPYLELVRTLFRLEPESPRATLDELEQFTRTVDLHEALIDSTKGLEKGDLDKAYEAIKKLARNDSRADSYGISRWMEEFDTRQAARKRRKEHPEEFICIPTGIPRLDAAIIGHAVGELGLIMSITAVGKSVMATHLGFAAICRPNWNVVHFCLEMNHLQVAQRYDSRFTGLRYRKFKEYKFDGDDLDVIKVKLDKNRARFTDRLQIISMPPRTATCDTLRGAMDDARREMGKIHMVIVDSGDHMVSDNRRQDFRHQVADVYWGLKGIAEEEECAVWSTTHAAKEAKGRLAGAESAAESYDKSRIADTVITLNEPRKRTRATPIVEDEVHEPEPEEEVKRPDLEMFLAKYRDGESKIIIPLDTDFERMLIKEMETAVD